MAEVFGFDAFSPKEIAERVEKVGVAKARLPWPSLALLGGLAGAFIGFGALYYTIVAADAALSFAVARVLGGSVFGLGLLLVVVAGAELFTGNNLLVMAWADGKITAREMFRNWATVLVANFVGAVALAALVFASGHPSLGGGAIAATTIKIAVAKCALPFWTAFFRAILCNVLVCLAVWMSLAGRSVVDKAVAIALPVSAFVAAGFEHSVANMYFLPLAMMLKAAGTPVPEGAALDVAGVLSNLGPVLLGNVVGGAGLVAAVYFVIYRLPDRKAKKDAAA